jgi:hypothetical protein
MSLYGARGTWSGAHGWLTVLHGGSRSGHRILIDCCLTGSRTHRAPTPLSPHRDLHITMKGSM